MLELVLLQEEEGSELHPSAMWDYLKKAANHEEGPHQNPTMQTSWSTPSSFQKLKDTNVRGLSHHSMAFVIAAWTGEQR